MALKDNYFTVSEAAKEIGVTRQTISRWVREGKVPAEKIGRETLIDKTKFDEYLRRSIGPRIADTIVDMAKLYVREAYDYVGRDSIELTNIHHFGGVFQFRVTKSDGTQEIVNVRAAVELKKKGNRPLVSFGVREIWQENSEGRAI